MPFLTVILLDFDCGVDRPQYEEVTSTDHSSHEGGENVTVTEYDDYVSFENKRGLIFNDENTPADVVLTEEQKSMHICAKWPRTILTAGISNKQWEGVVTPSPTPHLTDSNPTPCPTPSPTCAFSTVSGQCMLKFLTEEDFDLLWVNGQSYSYTEGPDGVEAEGQIEWTSDTQGTKKGWSICADAPTPSPTSPISAVGMCDADDRCVSSPNSPYKYGQLFFCSITFDVDATLHVVEFEIELFYDVSFLEDWVVDVRENPAAQPGWIYQAPDRWPCEAVHGCSLCSSISARGAHERYLVAARVLGLLRAASRLKSVRMVSGLAWIRTAHSLSMRMG